MLTFAGRIRKLPSATFIVTQRICRVSDEIASLPAWVRRRDGSQMPVDADRICQSLYAAAESLGTPSSFLTRELTDVVLHFLAKDPFTGIPRTSEIAEQVEKVV